MARARRASPGACPTFAVVRYGASGGCTGEGTSRRVGRENSLLLICSRHSAKQPRKKWRRTCASSSSSLSVRLGRCKLCCWVVGENAQVQRLKQIVLPEDPGFKRWFQMSTWFQPGFKNVNLHPYISRMPNQSRWRVCCRPRSSPTETQSL